MRSVADFYRQNPRMISSPFGGIDGVDTALFTEIFESLEIDLSHRTILDVGCGRGFLRELIHAAAGVYIGVDLVPSGQGFPLALADGAALPFPDQIFDAVACIDAFEHFPDTARAAREIRRVLRPGGFFFLSAPNYGNVAGVVKWTCEKTGRYDRDTWAPFGRWQPQELEQPLTGRKIRRLFTGAGFRVIRRIGLGREVGLGVFPWMDHPKTPEAIQFRLQRFFGRLGPPLANRWPALSLHNFWKMEV